MSKADLPSMFVFSVQVLVFELVKKLLIMSFLFGFSTRFQLNRFTIFIAFEFTAL